MTYVVFSSSECVPCMLENLTQITRLKFLRPKENLPLKCGEFFGIKTFDILFSIISYVSYENLGIR